MTSPRVNIVKKFDNGLYFSCKMCGTCCRGLYEGEVFLYGADIERLAEYLGLKGKRGLKEFCRTYVKIIDDTFYWKESDEKRGENYKFKTLGFKFVGKDQHCMFLGENNECKVRDARPFQCRAFPIGWNMLLKSIKTIKEYSKRCPALRGTLNNEGKYYSREEILDWAQKEYNIERDYFLELKNHKFDIFKVYPFLPKDITC